MKDTRTAIAKCRKCLYNWKCEIRGVVEFFEPIKQFRPDPYYTLENIFKAGEGDCPFFEINE